MRWRSRAAGAAAAALLALALPMAGREGAAAREPEPGQEAVQAGVRYTAELAPLDDEALAADALASSLLITRQEEPLDRASDLLRRARGDEERLGKVLRALGYYDGRISISAAGRDIAQRGIRTDLETAQTPIPVSIVIEPRSAYRLAGIAVDWLDAPPPDFDALAALGLAEGDAARGADIYAARARLIETLRGLGYPLAAAEEPDAVIDRQAKTMDVRFPVSAGGRAVIGPVTYTGNETVETALMARSQTVAVGEPYSPEALAGLRNELAALGVFSSVRVREGEALDARGRLPITVELTERKERFIGFGASFASDEGFGVNAEWGHRNLFGQAEQLTATANIDRIGTDIDSGIDYAFGLGFSKPAFVRGDQRLFANGAVLEESPDAFDRRAAVTEIGVERRLSPILSVSLGGSLELSEITEEGDAETFFLLGMPMALRLDTTDDLLNPTSGWRGSTEATPYIDLAVEDAPFFRFGGGLARYVDLRGTGRTILAGRVGLGATLGESSQALPADKRFFSGGAGSVRGYEFQALGPLSASGRPRGGRSLLEAGVELRQRFGENMGGVVFLDGGSAFNTIVPSGFEDIRYAAGFGFRYYTPIGPIRADIAFPLDRRSGDAGFQVYIGLGQAF